MNEIFVDQFFLLAVWLLTSRVSFAIIVGMGYTCGSLRLAVETNRYQKFSAMQTFRCSRSLFPENRSSERESEKLKRKVRTCYPKVRPGRRVIEVILVRMGHFCLVSKRS